MTKRTKVDRASAAWQPEIARLLKTAAEKLIDKIRAGEIDALDLVGIIRTSGELLVTYGALAPEEDPDAGDAGPRAGEAPDARPPTADPKR